MSERPPSKRRRSRPPRMPLPSLHPAERVRGSAILEENPVTGLLLWESYRNVGDWATTPRPARAALFGRGAAERRAEQLGRAGRMDHAVRAALETIHAMVAHPARTRAREVTLACRRLSAWAGEAGRPATQFYFAAAAGLCAPDDPRQAYQAGRLARDLARWDTAEAWLEYAVAAARRRRDRETQMIALLGLGNMFYRQGLYRRARETHLAGLSLARRHDLREFRGPVLHDLLVIAIELGDSSAAETYARHALAAYGPAHRRIPALAHDVAYFWLAEGRSAQAFPVLRALLPHLAGAPVMRVRVLASAARAAASLGESGAFGELLREVRRVGRDPLARGGLASAMVETAIGAALLGEHPLAGELLDQALDVARERGEVDVPGRVEELRRRMPASVLEVGLAGAVTSSPDELARELVSCLQAGGAAAGAGTAAPFAGARRPPRPQ